MLALAPALARAQAPEPLTAAAILSGQELIYRGRYGAAQVYFGKLATLYPREAAGPTLEASALIWWGEARGEDGFQAESIDVLLGEAIRRAQTASDSAPDELVRAGALMWLGTAYGYRARQAELHGNYWRAARDAKAMQGALEQALARDPACVDCLLGLGVYDYALARAGAVSRLVARIIGLGGGDAQRGLERMRTVAETGRFGRWEARWVYASALLREGERDLGAREEGLRLIGELALAFPENIVFRRVVETGSPNP